jgi:hypothetical protein
VQVAEPWFPPDVWKDVSNQQMDSILADIDKGLADGSRFTNKNSATTRAAWKVVVKHVPGKTEPQARDIIKTWIKNEVLRLEEYQNQKTYKKEEGLRVNREKAKEDDLPF